MTEMEMQQEPLVTIVAVCHKQRPYVLETLESIRHQTYGNIQLIIIDNHSDDGSDEVISEWMATYPGECEFIRNRESYSVSVNCNIGLQKARGKYFQPFSCDDVMMPGRIKKQVALFEELPEDFACVFGDMTFIDENSIEISSQTYFEKCRKNLNVNEIPNGDLRRLLSAGSIVPAPGALLRTEYLKKLDGYDENLAIEDWPMFIRLSRSGYKFYCLNEVVARYRILEGSLAGVIRYEKFNDLIKIFRNNSDYLYRDDVHFRQKWFNCIIYSSIKSRRAGIRNYIEYVRLTRDFRVKRLLQFIAYGILKRDIKRASRKQIVLE